MFRFTHRLCRAEVEGLADAARHQTESAEALADDLRAAEHQMEEVVNACGDFEYAFTEANIPRPLRERLQEAERLSDVEEELAQVDAENEQRAAQQEALLVAARAAGHLARTFALMEVAGMETAIGNETVRELLHVNFVGWENLPGWECEDFSCVYSVRELVWHPDRPGRAHLACECGRVWHAGSEEVVARAERETLGHKIQGTNKTFNRTWMSTPASVLEAVDRALGPVEVGPALVGAGIVSSQN